MRELLEKLLLPIAPSGSEGQAVCAIKDMIKDHVDEMHVDAMGSLIAVKKGQPGGKRIMLSAHMDHIGYVVTAIEAEGFLRVMPLGGVALNTERRHLIFPSGVHGIISAQPLRGGEGLATKHLFIDIGAQDRHEAEAMVSVGDCAVLAGNSFSLGAHRIAAPAMDDRCACALLVKALLTLEKPVNTIIAVFSSQEEIGCRGARVAAYAGEPDIGLALDVTGWGDTPETKDVNVYLGAGAAIKIMDRGSISSPLVRDALIACAVETGAPYQREVLPYGGTDASAMQAARGGMYVGTLSIPCRYVHSAMEVIDMRDMEAALTILNAFIRRDFSAC